MRIRLSSAGVALLFLTLTAMSLEGNLASLIPPPAGAKVAIVVFEDLEWPDCATAHPILAAAAKTHNVPLVIHDFPLPRHTWSFQAAVNARFFESQQQKLGDEFRGYIFQNQKLIGDEAALRQFTAKFAQEKQVTLPAVLDPDGKLAEAVTADFRLGQRIGLEHTPTVFVVRGSGAAIPFVETIDRHKLDRAIEDFEKKAGPAVQPRPADSKRR
ncbi:MAG TPA: thioredoxin domain-containing protein [Candidatus Angelobacter sp.]|nr:thioredoxin domain-containing protein [Candidatus Angelobacter sp.]